MQDPDILYLTASEPLTLEEEIENQQSWLDDTTKYTFIGFIKNEETPEYCQFNESKNYKFKELVKGYQMAGDINIFFHPYIEENEAEIDVMIGEKELRGKGLAKKFVEAMMKFGFLKFRKTKFIAKIKSDNQQSIKLFQDKLGF